MGIDWGSVVTHGLTGVGSFLLGMSKTIASWFGERKKQRKIEEALYKEFCRNLNHMLFYSIRLSPNPNYAGEYPKIEEWLRKDVYEHLREQPVTLTNILGGATIGEVYTLIEIVRQKDRSEHRREFQKIQGRLGRPGVDLSKKLLRKFSFRSQPEWGIRLTTWEHRYKPLARVFRFLQEAMMRNIPVNEGVLYTFDPYYGMLKALRKGMWGQPVVYDKDGFSLPLDKHWKPLMTSMLDQPS